MRQLSIGGKVVEMSEHDYLSSINNLAKGYYVLAEAYHNYHVSGFADLKDTFQMPDVGQNELEKAIVDQIDDDELSKGFASLREGLQKLKDLDMLIIDWLAKLVNVSIVQDKRDKIKIERRLKKLVASGTDAHPQGPVWVMHPEYRIFVEKSKNILADMSDTLSKTNQKIQQLLEKATRT